MAALPSKHCNERHRGRQQPEDTEKRLGKRNVDSGFQTQLEKNKCDISRELGRNKRFVAYATQGISQSKSRLLDTMCLRITAVNRATQEKVSADCLEDLTMSNLNHVLK